MSGSLDPFRFLLIAVAGWTNREQQQIVDYLREENRVLRAQILPRRLRLDDNQRRLAVRAKALRRRVSQDVATIVTPETLLRHRKLIAEKYDGSVRRAPGKPGMAAELAALVVRMATENRNWGYRKAHPIWHIPLHAGTIAKILKQHGFEPVPERVRKTTWKEFLHRHWEMIVAADFFTVEVWTRRGLRRLLVLFLIELSTRRLRVTSIARPANGMWMSQVALELTDPIDGLLSKKRYLNHDRDLVVTADFLQMVPRQ